MSTLIRRRPGTIKQTNPQPQTNNNWPRQQSNKKSSISVDLSNAELKTFPCDFQIEQASETGQLSLDGNNIVQCVVDLSLFSNLGTLSIQENKMKKFSIKRCITYHKAFNLKNLNLSFNNIQFVDLSAVVNLSVLNLSHNSLSTIILPQKYLQSINISYNTFSNIQHSVLSSRVFPSLTHLDISHNNRSIYDLILAVDAKQLTPMLKYLDCSHNVLSYIEFLPTSLEYLDLEYNHFIFDRRAVNEIIRLHRLKQLKITGNKICSSFVDILRTKTKYGTNSQLKLTYEQEVCVKQSPYKLYDDPQGNKKTIQGSITYSNFTLGDECDVKCDDEDVDPDYNLIKQKSEDEMGDMEEMAPCFSDDKLKYIQEKYEQQPPSALKNVQNSLKSQKFKLKIDGVRYQNHYRLYFQKIRQFMLIPPFPILHKDKNTNISIRIDPSSDQEILNQFQLFNQMFKSRGGIHYLRKIFNWQKTQKLKQANAKVLFINVELTKQQFDLACNGNYDIIQQACTQKHLLNQQPCSFSCFHVLARIDPVQSGGWSCLYLIEAVHL